MYHNATRGGTSHGHRGSAEKILVPEIHSWIDRHTDRQTDRNTPPLPGRVTICVETYT